MKQIVLFCICLLVSFCASAEETTDCFTLSSAELTPNGEYVCMTVGVQGSRKYTAYNLDITLPAGVDVYEEEGDFWVVMDEDEGIYPFTKKVGKKYFTHSLSFTYGEVGKKMLRVACYSSQNESFTANSGNLFQIYLVASAFAKPGKNVIKISGGNLTAIELDAGGKEVVKKYVPADAEYEDLTVGNQSTVALSINAENKYSTSILPFDYTPSSFKAYSTNGIEGNDYVVLKEATKMVAYTPYIIYSTTGFTGTAEGTVDESKYVATATDGLLTGAIEPQTITAGFVMQNKGNGAQFYNANGQTFTIPSGKCWLSESLSSIASLGFEVSPTKIDTTSLKPQENPVNVYDVNGRIVTNPQIGNIYIVNNKKVLKIK